MNRCPITYQLVKNGKYSAEGLKMLSRQLNNLSVLECSAQELREEAFQRAGKMSIQGVQPKLSTILNVKDEKFEIVDKNGKYIFKPQHHIFPQLPENEDLTMKLAATCGIDIPLHGLIYSKDGSLTYFIKRFDRAAHKDRLPMEDFAQLAGKNRDTKYNYSMEKLVSLVDEFCTFPAIEKEKLFKLVLFNYLVGNEDMHLKNYSVITREGITTLSPVYDLLNTTIVLKGDIEEIALTLKGKKKNLSKTILMDYFGKEKCKLTDKSIESVLADIKNGMKSWPGWIEKSFLSDELKEKYMVLLEKRKKLIFFLLIFLSYKELIINFAGWI
jgi:serine/threonine-protein kinase HipA